MGHRDMDEQSEHTVCGKSSSTGVFTENDLLEVLLGLFLDAATMPVVRTLPQAMHIFRKGQLF